MVSESGYQQLNYPPQCAPESAHDHRNLLDRGRHLESLVVSGTRRPPWTTRGQAQTECHRAREGVSHIQPHDVFTCSRFAAGVCLFEEPPLLPSLSMHSTRTRRCFNRVEAMLIYGDGHAKLVVDTLYAHNLPMAVEANRASRIGVFQ